MLRACAIRVSLAIGLALSLAPPAGAAPSFDEEPKGPTAAESFAAGKMAFDAKDWDGVIKHMNAVVSEERQNADAWSLLGYAHRMQKKYDKALLYYSKALAMNPEHRGALAYSGKAYADLGDVAKASTQLSKLEAACEKAFGAGWQAKCDGRDELIQAIAAVPPAAKPQG